MSNDIEAKRQAEEAETIQSIAEGVAVAIEEQIYNQISKDGRAELANEAAEKEINRAIVRELAHRLGVDDEIFIAHKF